MTTGSLVLRQSGIKPVPLSIVRCSSARRAGCCPRCPVDRNGRCFVKPSGHRTRALPLLQRALVHGTTDTPLYWVRCWICFLAGPCTSSCCHGGGGSGCPQCARMLRPNSLPPSSPRTRAHTLRALHSGPIMRATAIAGPGGLGERPLVCVPKHGVTRVRRASGKCRSFANGSGWGPGANHVVCSSLGLHATQPIGPPALAKGAFVLVGGGCGSCRSGSFPWAGLSPRRALAVRNGVRVLGHCRSQSLRSVIRHR